MHFIEHTSTILFTLILLALYAYYRVVLIAGNCYMVIYPHIELLRAKSDRARHSMYSTVKIALALVLLLTNRRVSL